MFKALSAFLWWCDILCSGPISQAPVLPLISKSTKSETVESYEEKMSENKVKACSLPVKIHYKLSTSSSTDVYTPQNVDGSSEVATIPRI